MGKFCGGNPQREFPWSQLIILEQLGYEANEEEIIGSANLNGSQNPYHKEIGLAKLSLILLIIR